MKKIFKYGTGFEVPEGAIYLTTIVEERRKFHPDINPSNEKVRLVWHYFLVDVKEWNSKTNLKDIKTMEEEDLYKEFKDKDGNYIMCPICGSDDHTDGRCEQFEYDYD